MNISRHAALAAVVCHIALCQGSITVAEWKKWKTETVAETANSAVVFGQTFRPSEGSAGRFFH